MPATMPSLDAVVSTTSHPGMETLVSNSSSSSSSSSFPTDSEYLDKPLSVWLGETHEDGRVSHEIREFSPLDVWTAASIGHYDFVKRIVENKVPICAYSHASAADSQPINNDLNARNKGGWTALMYAAYIGHDNIVNLLLAQDSIDVNLKSSPSGQREVTALILASSCGNEAISTALLQRGADVNARDKKGWTALFHATNGNHAGLVKLLLRNGATLECSEPKHGYTPLMLAAWEGLEMIVTSFLAVEDSVKLKACVNAKNRSGDTARSLAYQRGHTKIVSLIDEFLCRSRNESPTSLLTEGVRPAHPAAAPGPPGKTPSILDGPEAFERLRINGKPNTARRVISDESAPKDGSVSEVPDHDADDDPFGNTAAVTIRSSGSGSASRGLAAALGLNPGVEEAGEGGDKRLDNLNVNNNLPSVAAAEGQRLSEWPQRPPPFMANRATNPSVHPPPKPKMDLPTLLTSLGLQKYISVFEESEVDLPVFLTLTDSDLRECGITLFGPRRKMTSAIARYHSYASISQSRAGSGGTAERDASLLSNNNANEISWIESLECGDSNPLEKAYADKLEVEMQEMAIRLHQTLAKEKESLSTAQKNQRQLNALEANFQQISNFLYELRKSLSHSRKLGGRAAQLLAQIEQSVHQSWAPPSTQRHDGDESNANWNQRQPQQQHASDRPPPDLASTLPSLAQYQVDLESLTARQINGIDDLLRKFNRGNEGSGGGHV